MPSVWESAGLHSGGLLSRATDFGSLADHNLGAYTLGVYTLGVHSLGQRFSDLDLHLLSSRKFIEDPLTQALFREKKVRLNLGKVLLGADRILELPQFA